MKILRVVLLVSLTLAVSVAKSDQGESLRGKVDDGTSALNADVVDLLNRNLKKEDDDGKETGGGGDKGPKKDQQKVKICHGTASPTNPYVIIEVADDAASDNPGSLGGHINNPKHNDPSKNKNSDVLMGADTPDFPGCKTNDRCQVCCPDQKCYGDGDKPEPKPTEPQPTEPEPTEPEPTEPKPTEPGPTKPSDPSPTKPSVSGDPHFAMFGTSHRKYDFHGACDLVFLDNPDYNNGQGMKIHIRTKIVKWWSYVEQVVVQIGNDTLEVMGGVEQKRYWVNGEAGPMVKQSHVMPFTIGGHAVRFRVRNENQFQFKIFLENGQEIVLRSVKDFLKVDLVHHTEESFGTSMGLLGTYVDGLMMARNGMTIIEDPNEFGNEWQVRDDEPMLFHNVDKDTPQYPDHCTMPTPEQATKRRLGEGSISREAAIKACIHASSWDLEDCVTDVMATGDKDMAGAF